MVVPDPRTPMYTGIGVVVVSWAFVEDFDKFCVSLFYHKCGVKSTDIGKAGIPRTQFTRKLTFLTDSLNQVDMLALYKDKGLELIDRAKILCDDRDTLIHGVCQTITPESIKLVKYAYNKKDRKENKPNPQTFRIFSHRHF